LISFIDIVSPVNEFYLLMCGDFVKHNYEIVNQLNDKG